MSGRDERRRDRRRYTVDDHGVLSTRIGPGEPARVLDVSSGGALVDTPMRLLPGTTVEVRMATRQHRIAIRGEVVRCAVVRLGPMVYRGALRFERPIGIFDGCEVVQEIPVREEATRGVL
ncbi:MAG TPA: PilZ domain-containing protein [Vicinamibacterales bacterium]|nr:PilZ domain-containing protein [Vicinamibacterales bacterium]